METINELTTSVPLDTTGLNRVSITILETRVYLHSHEPICFVEKRTKKKTVIFSFPEEPLTLVSPCHDLQNGVQN